MSGLTVGIRHIGLAAPGLLSWLDGQAVLRGEVDYQPEALARYAPTLLPPNERRRTSEVGRLAFQSAEEAIGGIDGEAWELASVFASSGGDTDIVNRLCLALASDERPVSPTQFHNSVHNAAAGYWSIATRSRGASSSLSAFDGSFAAGLVEAATLACCEKVDVLLVAYDMPVPPPLDAKRPVSEPFTTAMVLTRDAGNTPHRLHIALDTHGDETRLDNPGLEALRTNNPAARALPLLQAIARGHAERITLPSIEGTWVNVRLEVVS